MSHVECRNCKTRNHYSSYGCGGPFGGMSSYTYCEDCGRVLECHIDTEGMESDEDEAFQAKVDAVIEAQFAPGGKPIETTATQIGGIFFSYAAHIPDQPNLPADRAASAAPDQRVVGQSENQP